MKTANTMPRILSFRLSPCHIPASSLLCHFRYFLLLSFPQVSPLSFPQVPFCHSRRFLAGIQGLFLRSLPSCTSPSGKKPLDSRLKMSGMTGGASGMTGGMLGMTEWTSARLRINRRPYILYPTVLCPSRRVPSVLPAEFPLSFPPGSLCPSRPSSLCPSRPSPLCPSRPGPSVRPARGPSVCPVDSPSVLPAGF